MTKSNEKVIELSSKLSELINESKTKKAEMEILKQIKLKLEEEYNNYLNIYQNLMTTIISKENNVQQIQNKIAKLKLKQNTTLNFLTPQFFIHLQDIIQNNTSKDILTHFFKLVFFEHWESPQEIIKILKNEEEIKSMLLYCFNIYHQLYKENKEKYEYKKNYYESIKTKKELNSFPFDFLFDYIGKIFLIIEHYDQYENLINSLSDIILHKNNIFVNLKRVERELLENNTAYNELMKYLNRVNIIAEKFNSLNVTQKKSINELKEFIKAIKLLKTYNIENSNNNENINSLYTQSKYTYNNINSIRKQRNLSVALPKEINEQNKKKTKIAKVISKKKDNNFNGISNIQKMTIKHNKTRSEIKNTPKKGGISKTPIKNNVKILLKSHVNIDNSHSFFLPKTLNKNRSNFTNMCESYSKDERVLEKDENGLKDSICDEMLCSQGNNENNKILSYNYLTKATLQNFSLNHMINPFLNNNNLHKKEIKNKVLVINKSIESSNCCTVCT